MLTPDHSLDRYKGDRQPRATARGARQPSRPAGRTTQARTASGSAGVRRQATSASAWPSVFWSALAAAGLDQPQGAGDTIEAIGSETSSSRSPRCGHGRGRGGVPQNQSSKSAARRERPDHVLRRGLLTGADAGRLGRGGGDPADDLHRRDLGEPAEDDGGDDGVHLGDGAGPDEQLPRDVAEIGVLSRTWVCPFLGSRPGLPAGLDPTGEGASPRADTAWRARSSARATHDARVSGCGRRLGRRVDARRALGDVGDGTPRPAASAAPAPPRSAPRARTARSRRPTATGHRGASRDGEQQRARPRPTRPTPAGSRP